MWYWLTIFLTFSPILVGIVFYLGDYFGEEFYKHPFYEDYEDSETSEASA